MKALLVFGLVIFFSIGVLAVSDGYSQTQRNPVLEFCTGTW